MASSDADEGSRSIADWCKLSDASAKAGDHLGACDSALLGLEQHPSARELQYRAILGLSRAGAKKRARQLWEKCDLTPKLETESSQDNLEENIAALGARLDREAALAIAPGEERSSMLKAAAARYEAIYRRTRGTFPGINAAVLYELSGDEGRAKKIAARIVEQCERSMADTAEGAFQVAADRAAASLLLDRLDAGQAAIADAAKLASNASSVASTRKQLIQICEHKRIDRSILSKLRNRSIIHYTCQEMPDHFPNAEASITDAIAKELTDRNVGYAYGSLGSPADALIVELLLERQAEVCVVLPCNTNSFRNGSVAGAGHTWLSRFDQSLKRVRLIQATDGDYAGDLDVFAHSSRLAMGMALLAAQNLCTDVVQLAVSDQSTANARSAVREWKRLGLETIPIIASEASSGTKPGPGGPSPTLPTRKVRAIIFGDFEHFSRLDDRQMLTFFDRIMGCVAETLDRYEGHIVTRNTWGDGIYIVLDDIEKAARCALEIQTELGRIDLPLLGLPATLGLRIGLHAGAVFEIQDPVLKSIGFTGTDISRTARIEPTTPPGEVYVTEAFAALLTLTSQRDLACDYVGLMNLPKGYGRLRTYWLRAV
jgi:Tetratricopeptide Repeats-Sensor/Adenylate and Guanylate cyclase catalytic domain